jgi:hypothetical protein
MNDQGLIGIGIHHKMTEGKHNLDKKEARVDRGKWGFYLAGKRLTGPIHTDAQLSS